MIKYAFFLLVMISPAFIAAQDAPNQERMVNVSFRAVFPRGQPDSLAFRSNGRVQQMNMLSAIEAVTFKYSGPANLEFFREKLIEGEKQKISVCSVVIPENVAQVMILMLPQSGESYVGVAVPDMAADFPLDNIRIYNAAPVPLAFKCNDVTFQLPPNKYRLIALRDVETVAISVAMQKNQRWSVIKQGAIPFNSNQRMTAFITLSGNADSVSARIFRYSDTPPVEEDSSKSQTPTASN